MKRPPLRSFGVRNFKAIHDTADVNFTPLTVLIGNNGVGKSSLIEGLETFRDVLLFGVDSAMRPWRGIEHVWNNAVPRKLIPALNGRFGYSCAVNFTIEAESSGQSIWAKQVITLGEGRNSLFIADERVSIRTSPDSLIDVSRDAEGRETIQKSAKDKATRSRKRYADGESCLTPHLRHIIDGWQFLTLSPDAMGQPVPEERGTARVRLAKNGANVAEYLNEIRDLDLNAFNGIVDALRSVLPFAADLQPTLTSELERAFYLKLKEGQFEVPGWLLSTGTLRIAALLACLRHPKPPALLVVEEIENGLDPSTLHLVVEEIRTAITMGTTQVILTTHSPYLLDLLDLSHIVIVEREDGQPVFRRPDKKQLAEWSKSFSPGALYTMGRLTRGGK